MRGRLLAASLVLVATALGGTLLDPDSPPADSLRQIPAASRRALADQLRAFDRLPREEQAAIRALDRQLQEMPIDERLRLESVLHRYYLWTLTLPEDRRRALEQASPADRIALVRQFRGEGQPERDQQANQVFAQSAVLSPISLFESAFLLKVWFRMTPAEQKQTEAIKAFDQRMQRFATLAAEKQVARDEFDELKRQATAEMPRGPALKAREVKGRGLLMARLAEARYLLQQEPEPVAPDELLRFQAGMPTWFRETLTPLAPDAARRRLTLLYRLVFADGAMPPSPTPQPRSRPTPTPGRPPAGNAGPTPF